MFPIVHEMRTFCTIIMEECLSQYLRTFEIFGLLIYVLGNKAQVKIHHRSVWNTVPLQQWINDHHGSHKFPSFCNGQQALSGQDYL